MKVLLLVDDRDLGKAGDEAEGPEVWRACFPCGGEIRALPLDEEAHAEVNRELSTVHPGRRQQLEDQFTLLRAKHPAAALASQAAAPEPGAEAGTESTPQGEEAKTATAPAPVEKTAAKKKGGGGRAKKKPD